MVKMDDICYNVFIWLDYGSIYKCMQVCKQYYGVLSKEIFWKSVYDNNYLGCELQSNYYETCKYYKLLSSMMNKIKICKLIMLDNHKKYNTGYWNDEYYLINNEINKRKSVEYNPYFSTVDYNNTINFKEIKMPNSGMTHIFKNINLLENLTVINFSDNDIEELYSGIFLLNNLERLCLHNNKISVIPSEIGLLCNLKSLTLSMNKISVLSSEIGLLGKLTYLGLERNCISEIPSEMCMLLELHTLNIMRNNIKVLPCGLMEMPMLVDVIIDDDVIVGD